MKEYEVTWVIELSASSPEEAAKLALEIQKDPKSIATQFLVRQLGSAIPRQTIETSKEK